MEGHRLVPHGYSNHESGDVLYVRYIDPADHDAPAVRALLAKVTATALRAIRSTSGRPT